ncbi:coiled-coil domain-containing protein 127 isoform X2 [Poecile atricapillus]|uniref:coiled-coil domain-containing protein 127 isoform X2 n=1 Tax=Poecile atricapillus TaxID=48891 RepID=UPI002738861D|nr:coiled-coil domain-containing protein 127 isoform X2 [Poecile atricapillus]
MNNLNEPPNWNILPNRRGPGDDGSRWNYALLVPMLGLAAFRWIWTRECQKEIEKERQEYYRKESTLQKDLEGKYRDIITENRRAVAHLEVELEKERNRTLSYREALVSQSRKLVEERKLLEQEQEKLEREKQVLLQSGAEDGNLNAACTGSHYSLSTCPPELKYILFSAALKFCACGSPLYIHMTMKAYRFTSFAHF